MITGNLDAPFVTVSYVGSKKNLRNSTATLVHECFFFFFVKVSIGRDSLIGHVIMSIRGRYIIKRTTNLVETKGIYIFSLF